MGIGRKGRSCAWPPSRRVTSKSPMHAGVASSLDRHARVVRRARQRRRSYQSGKGRATNRGGPGGRQAHRWSVGSARDLPRPVPRHAARAGVSRLVLLGDPPSFDEDDSDPHCCVKPLDAVALPSLAATAACRTRHGPPASCSAPMVSRSRCLLTVRPGDASQATATTSNATTVSASMQDICRVPSRPANIPEVSRGRRLPYAMSTPPAIGRMAHRVRFAPTARRSSGMAHPCPRGCISRRKSTILAYRATAVRHLGVAIHELWIPAPAPDFHRLSGLTSLSEWLPTTLPKGSSHMAATIAPAPKRHHRNLVITLAAAAFKADLAPRHYRIAPPGDMPRKAPSAASGHRPVVTGRCASARPIAVGTPVARRPPHRSGRAR